MEILKAEEKWNADLWVNWIEISDFYLSVLCINVENVILYILSSQKYWVLQLKYLNVMELFMVIMVIISICWL